MKYITTILGLFALGIVLTGCGNDDDGGNNSGSVEISTFNIKNAVSLALYNAPNTRAWHLDTDEDGNPYEWFDGPVVIQIDARGNATPVISFSHDGLPVEWYCGSITYMTSNYVLFETDRQKSNPKLASYYLVRISDGKAFAFQEFDYSEIIDCEDDYLYIHNLRLGSAGSANNGIPTPTGDVIPNARLHLPGSGNIKVEELPINVNRFTKNFLIGGTDYSQSNMIMHKTDGQSYAVPNGCEIIGVDYDSDKIYFTAGYDVYEAVMENGNLLATDMFSIENDRGYDGKEWVISLFAINDNMLIIGGENCYIYNRLTGDQKLVDTDLSYNGNAGSLTINRLQPHKFTVTTQYKEMYVIDLLDEGMLYMLFDPADYPKYSVTGIQYLNTSDRLSLNALRLADSKKVLLSIDVKTGGELTEVEEYDNMILEIIPIN